MAVIKPMQQKKKDDLTDLQKAAVQKLTGDKALKPAQQPKPTTLSERPTVSAAVRAASEPEDVAQRSFSNQGASPTQAQSDMYDRTQRLAGNSAEPNRSPRVWSSGASSLSRYERDAQNLTADREKAQALLGTAKDATAQFIRNPQERYRADAQVFNDTAKKNAEQRKTAAADYTKRVSDAAGMKNQGKNYLGQDAYSNYLLQQIGAQTADKLGGAMNFLKEGSKASEQRYAADAKGLTDAEMEALQSSIAKRYDNSGLAKATEKVGAFVERENEKAAKNAENLTGAQKLFGQGVGAAAAMVPEALASRGIGSALAGAGEGVEFAQELAGKLGLGMMFTSASGSATQQTKKEGFDDKTAIGYGLAIGAIEAATENMFAGVPFYGKSYGDISGAITNGIKSLSAKPGAKFLLQSVVNLLGEGAEEFTSELADAFVEKGILGKYGDKGYLALAKEKLPDAWNSFLVGAMSALVMNAASGQYGSGARQQFASEAQLEQAKAAFDALPENEKQIVSELVQEQNQRTASMAAQDKVLSQDRETVRAEQETAPGRAENTDLAVKYPSLDLNQNIDGMDGVPAVELSDGSVLPVPAMDGHTDTHVTFIQKNGIEPQDIKSGGWIANGIYEGSPRSDTQRYVEQQLAAQRMEQRRKLEMEHQDDTQSVVQKLKRSIPQLADISPVANLSGNEFPRGEKRLSEMVQDFFSSIGNSVSRVGFGNIALSRNGIKSDIAHGIGRRKALTFAAVPSVIEHGKQIDFEENWKGRGEDSYVFAAPVNVGSEINYVAAIVMKSRQDNEFYLHEVVDEHGNKILTSKKDTAPFKTGTSDEVATPRGAVSTDPTITETASGVNTQDMQEPSGIYRTGDDLTDGMASTLLAQEKQAPKEPDLSKAMADELLRQDGIERAKASDDFDFSVESLIEGRDIGKDLLLERMQENAAPTSDVQIEELLRQEGGIEGAKAAAAQGGKDVFTLKDGRAIILGKTDAKKAGSSFEDYAIPREKLDSAAGRLIREYRLTDSPDSIRDRLAALYEIYEMDGATAAKRREYTETLAASLMANARPKLERTQELQNTLDYISESPISLTDSQRKELRGAGYTMAEFRKAVSPIKVNSDPNADLETKWSEWAESGLSTGHFMADENAVNMPLKLMEIVGKLKKRYNATDIVSETQFLADSIESIYSESPQAPLPPERGRRSVTKASDDLDLRAESLIEGRDVGKDLLLEQMAEDASPISDVQTPEEAEPIGDAQAPAEPEEGRPKARRRRLLSRLLGIKTGEQADPRQLDGVKQLLDEGGLGAVSDTYNDVERAQMLKGNELGSLVGFDTLERTLDNAAAGNGEARSWLEERIEKPLYNAKAEYSKNVETAFDSLRRMVERTGIKAGTKESAAVQWYGEGRRWVDETVDPKSVNDHFEPYTLKDLRKEFPERWSDIVLMEGYFRKVYDNYCDRINAVLEKIYPDVEIEEYRKLNALTYELEQLQKQYENISEKLKAGVRTADYSPEVAEYVFNQLRKQDAKLEEQWGRIRSGDYLIGKRMQKKSDYFHHFQAMEDSFAGLKNILKNTKRIDATLVGISENTKPKMKWWGAMQRRAGEISDADAVGGMARYIPSGEYLINIDPYISNMRGVVKQLADATRQTRNANTLIQYLTEFTNSIAGKTSPLDRTILKLFGEGNGRGIVEAVNRFNNRVRSNAVLGNFNSAVAQLANIPNAMSIIKSNTAWAKAVKDYAATKLQKNGAEELIAQSNFLRERYLDTSPEQFGEKDLGGSVKDFAAKVLEFGDREASRLIWFAAYEEALEQGSENAVYQADRATRRAVAGRGIGEVPFEMRGKVTNLFMPFQVEVDNAWQNTKQLVKNKDASGILRLMIGSYLLNAFTKAVAGRAVLPDLLSVLLEAIKAAIDKDEDESYGDIARDAAANAAGEVVSMIPGSSTLAPFVFGIDSDAGEALFGEGNPSRYGTGLIGATTLLDPVIDYSKARASGKTPGAALQQTDLVTPALNVLLPYGGKQVARTYEALQDYGVIPDGAGNLPIGETREVPGSYTDSGKLRFTLDNDALEIARAMLFGSYGTKAGQAYLEGGRKTLSESKTQQMIELSKLGIEPSEYLAAYEAQKNAQYESGVNLAKSTAQKAAIDEATPGLTEEERELLYAAFSVSEKVW